MELIKYYNDPENFMNPPKTGKELDETRNRMSEGLERLRSNKTN